METRNDKPQLIHVVPTHIPGWWGELRPYIENACERGGWAYYPLDILKDLLCRKLQLWIARSDEGIEAVAVTILINYPRLKECRIIMTVGEDYKSWISFINDIEGWAKTQGCERSVAMTRPGWEKPLASYGYHKAHVELVKSLTGSIH